MGNDNQETTELGDQMLDDRQQSDLQDTQQTEFQKLKEERDSLYDRLLRKQAEFENYKKRIDREKAEFAQFASFDLMRELLNALDSVELALRNAALEGKGSEDMRCGFELIHKQLQDTLAR